MRPSATIVFALAALAVPGCNEDIFIQTPPSMQIGIESIEFGAVAVGRTVSRTVVIQNTGASPLRLNEPSFTDDPDGVFQAPEYDTEIGPVSQGTMTVTFSPLDVTRYEAIMLVSGNDQDNPSAEIRLSGEGFRQGALEVFPQLVDFGKVNAGDVGLGQVIIRNSGNGKLLVTGIELSSTTHPDFGILSSTQPGELDAGTEIPIRLAYRPGLGSNPPDDGLMVIRAADPFNPREDVVLRASLNRSPVADAGDDREVDPLTEVQLDGSKSYDPDGDLPLEYSWELVRQPDGSETVLVDASSARPSLVPDLVGVYEAELRVKDSTGLENLLPDRVVITAIPAERLLLELVWDSPIADLDLHMLAPGGIFGGIFDCFFDNRNPDWGEPGLADDDPVLVRDDLMGFGPEVIGYNEPVGGTYSFVIDYFAAHTPSGEEPTTATLRVFVDGILEAEVSRRLESQGQRWTAGTVKWPEGTVEEIDVLE